MALRLRVFLVLVIGFALSALAHGQLAAKAPREAGRADMPSGTQVRLGQSSVALNGPWKFHVGDSPVDSGTGRSLWAQPDFNDSDWETVDLTSGAGAMDPINGMTGYAPGWTVKGHPGYWGYAWYRIRVRLETQPGEKLALAGPADVDDVYQAFANGSLLGSFGGFSSGRPVSYYSQPKMFLLPESETASRAADAKEDSNRVIEVAFRVWMEPNSLINQPDAGGFHTAPVLGEVGAVSAAYQLRWLELIRSYAFRVFEGVLFSVISLIALSLLLFDRSDRVYLWIAGVFLLLATTNMLVGFGAWTQYVSYIVPQFTRDVFLAPLAFAGWVMVWWTWFRLRRPAWIPKAVVVLLLLVMLSNALGEDLFFNLVPHPIAAAFHVLSLTIRGIFLLLMVTIVILGTRREGLEGFLVLPAVTFLGIAWFGQELGVLHVQLTWFPFGVSVSLTSIANLLLLAGLTVLLFRRLVRSVQQQRLLAQDVKQAQEVQQVILPQARAIFHGLAIESEYRPAREVGGDFFQIIPHPSDGSILIVAGDVAGKGLKAGMLVALLVGAIRSTAELKSDPEFILRALNRRLIGRGESHATCLALRIGKSGQVHLANAGHMPPYLNGKPVDIDGSLPLGLLPEAECSMLDFQLEEGDRLVLLSDGIAEATDANGQLFGFSRIDELLQTRLSAADVADAAQSFGQEDDISVISVTRMAVPVLQ